MGPATDGTGRAESGVECAEVRQRPADQYHARRRRRYRDARGDRSWHRDRARGPATDLRAIRTGGAGRTLHRAGPRALHHEGHRRGPRRDHPGDQRARPGHDVRGSIATSEEPAMTAARCRGVLVVDDDTDIRETIEEVLADNDFPAIGAENGAVALERLRSDVEPPCVILLDMMMPVMDGRTFRLAQQDDPTLSDIPVVVLSAHASGERAARELHVAGF